MTRRARLSPLAAVAASAALSVPLVPLAAPAAARPARFAADTVAIAVQDVSPAILPTSATPAPFTVTLTVTNRSQTNLTGLTIEGERGEPLTDQAELDDAIKHVSPPSGHVVPIEPTSPVRLDLAAGDTEQVVFRSTTSTANDDTTGLCNCAQPDRPWIYPLYFSGHVKGAGGVDQVLGLANTFVSAFARAPAPVHVGWVWPLLDQPHLLDDTPVGTGGPVFTDDFLTASVGTGGRLDKSLAVLERVAQDAPDVPITVLIDPELLNELELMATGPYQVQAGHNRLVPGTGKAQATAWLDRLRTLLGTAGQLRVQLTAYADPDVQALHEAGLSWSTTLPSTIQQRVTTALGSRSAESSLSWPAGGTVSRSTLSAMVARGIGTVLIDSRRVAPRTPAAGVRPGLARLASDGRDVGVGLLDPTVQGYVQQAVTATGGPGTAVLPQLMSELTIRAVQEPTTQHVAILTPPRWVDPDVDAAARTIETTSHSLVTRPIALGDAVGGELIPNGRRRLTAAPASASTLPEASLAAGGKLAGELPTLRGLLTPPKPATPDPPVQALLAALPLEGQRVGSSAWGRPGNATSAARFARGLTSQLDTLASGVKIVTSSGSYTLASDNSPLPITVENNLPYQVTVTVEVTPLNGLPGFKAKPSTKVVGARQKATLRLATSVDRTGRIRVVATLYTPDGQHRVGDAVEMTVRSTALGVVGVVITVVAGAVLVLALLIRFGRRLRNRKRRIQAGRPRRPHLDPDAPAPAPVGGDAQAAQA